MVNKESGRFKMSIGTTSHIITLCTYVQASTRKILAKVMEHAFGSRQFSITLWENIYSFNNLRFTHVSMNYPKSRQECRTITFLYFFISKLMTFVKCCILDVENPLSHVYSQYF